LESKELLASFKKRYNLAIKKAKVDATETFIKNNKSNPRVFWNILGSYRQQSKQNGLHSISSDEFNAFFSSVAGSIISALPPPKQDPISYMSVSDNDKEIFLFRKVSFIEVRDIYSKLKISNTKDIYGLSTYIVKNFKNILIPPLTKLINHCIEEKIVMI
jgi:hypothetical protein